ncbi:putative glycolipid-binding domain-containing protein [Sutcliffiella halmapala]
MTLKVVWKNEEKYGCEYFIIVETDNNTLLAEGTVIYVEEEVPTAHEVEYSIELDKNWITRKLSILVDKQTSLEIHSDGEGNWFNTEGDLLEFLKGAIDIDISATPFSNSLPVNRFNWIVNQIEHIEIVYISVPSLELKKVSQSYRYIGNNANQRYFNYCCNDYETIITVDSDGFVIDYPNVFSRKYKL